MCMTLNLEETEEILGDLNNTSRGSDVIRGYKLYYVGLTQKGNPRLSSPVHPSLHGGEVLCWGTVPSSRSATNLSPLELEVKTIRDGLHVLRTRAAAESYRDHYPEGASVVIVPVTYRREDIVGYGHYWDRPDILAAVVTRLFISRAAFEKATQTVRTR